jgi:5-methylcytosine-specific restriction endonuclease McrA
MTTKICSKCKQEKQLSEFQPDKSKKSGYKSQCKECIKNNFSRQKYLKEYRENNKDYFREKHAEYRERNREKLKTQAREYREQNPDKIKYYYIKNRDRILKYSREYNHSEHGAEVRKIYSKSETAKSNKTFQRYIRKSKVKDGDKNISLAKLYERDGGICKICGSPCDYNDYIISDNVVIVGSKYPSIDHIKPLSKGGSHTWDNVQLAHKQCNSIKRDKEAM